MRHYESIDWDNADSDLTDEFDRRCAALLITEPVGWDDLNRKAQECIEQFARRQMEEEHRANYEDARADAFEARLADVCSA